MWARARRRIFEIVEVAQPGDKASQAFDISIAALIVLNIAAVILESVKPVYELIPAVFYWTEFVSVAVFSLEYLLRVWSAVELRQWRQPFTGRMRFALTPLAIIDLAAIAPFYLPLLGVDLRALRVFRLVRLLRMLKLVRYSESLGVLGRVFKRASHQLVLVATGVLGVLLLASCFMYYVEYPTQPEAFSSIPAAAWWAVSALTTVGYGDVVPVTAVGRLIAGVISVLGVAIFALPTAILGAAFVEEMRHTAT